MLSLSENFKFVLFSYCSPKYDFPSQEEVVSFVVQKVRDAVKSNPKTLVVCGTYSIGKEKIFLGMYIMYLYLLKHYMYRCCRDAAVESVRV